jgi:beta-galactosidase
MKRILLIGFLIVYHFANAQLVDKTPAPVPVVPTVYSTEPWEDPLVSGINREPSRATAYSFNSVADALKGDRTKSRMLSLHCQLDFLFASKPVVAPEDFY